MAYPVKYDDRAEFFGQIIDIFEDFLAEKKIEIENEEREDYGAEDDEELAIIFGSDYDYIRDRLAEMMARWGIAEED